MNKLSNSKRAQILEMLVEGMSMRAASRIAKVSINTVTKLMIEAGEACAAYHDKAVRNVTASKVQCGDEIWAFCYAKEKNVERAKAAPQGAGDVWTWTAIEGASKLILSYEVGDRSGQTANEFMDDLRGRLANRVQLTTRRTQSLPGSRRGRIRGRRGLCPASEALRRQPHGTTSGHEKKYSPAECTGTKKRDVEGSPDAAHVSTSYVERQNLSMRMGMRALYPANERIQQEDGEPPAHAEPVISSTTISPVSKQGWNVTPDPGRWHQRSDATISPNCASVELTDARATKPGPASDPSHTRFQTRGTNQTLS